MSKIIFSDIDGTFVFHNAIHHIRRVGSLDEGFVDVLDPMTGRNHAAYDVSTPSYEAYMDINTKSLAEDIQRSNHFVFVSAARKETMDGRKHALNFADAYILESGAIILDEAYQPDKEWAAMLEPQRPHLQEVNAYLIDRGWRLNNEGRTAASRVRRIDNPQRSDSEFKELCDDLVVPPELKKTQNIGSLDIILASAGKDLAAKYVMEKLGYKREDSIAIGDDINDMEVLSIVGKPYVLGSGYPTVIQMAKEKGWYISEGVHFDGINEILKDILYRR